MLHGQACGGECSSNLEREMAWDDSLAESKDVPMLKSVQLKGFSSQIIKAVTEGLNNCPRHFFCAVI